MSFFPFPIHPLVLFSFLHSLSLSGHPFFTHYFDSQWLLSSTASFMCSETLLSLPTIASQHLEKWLAAKRSSMNCHSSVAKSSLTLQPWGLQHARIPSPPLSLGFCSNSCPLSKWCYPTISSSATPFFFFFAFNLSQHQGLFKWAVSSYQVATVLEPQLQHQFFQRISSVDFLPMNIC